MNKETLKRALEAEGTEPIECPVCGDRIPAYELATDHAHTGTLLRLVRALADEVPDDRLAALAAQHAASSESTKDDYYGDDEEADDLEDHRERVQKVIEEDSELLDELAESGSDYREFSIRYDPNHVATEIGRERLRRLEEAESEEERQRIPAHHSFGVADEDEYERIVEASEAVARAFIGEKNYSGFDLVVCPDCGHEGLVRELVFPPRERLHEGESDDDEE